jgi:hypothetical protein
MHSQTPLAVLSQLVYFSWLLTRRIGWGWFKVDARLNIAYKIGNNLIYLRDCDSQVPDPQRENVILQIRQSRPIQKPMSTPSAPSDFFPPRD